MATPKSNRVRLKGIDFACACQPMTPTVSPVATLSSFSSGIEAPLLLPNSSVVFIMIASLTSFITMLISAGGYSGIIVLMAIESACIPLPSEIIMPFAGYLVSRGELDLFWVATAGALGCNIGSSLAYWAGASGGRHLVQRYGRYVLLGASELEWADRFFARYGSFTVFAGRLMPIVRTFISLPAGMTRMKIIPFQLYTFLGSWPWCYLLAWAGMKLGQAWDKNPALKNLLHRFDAVIAGLLVAAILWFLWSRIGRQLLARIRTQRR